jgi:hypothetical protein
MIGADGKEVWRTGEWGFTVQGKTGDPLNLKGFWSAINVREGDTLKIRMLTFNVTPLLMQLTTRNPIYSFAAVGPPSVGVASAIASVTSTTCRSASRSGCARISRRGKCDGRNHDPKPSPRLTYCLPTPLWPSSIIR